MDRSVLRFRDYIVDFVQYKNNDDYAGENVEIDFKVESGINYNKEENSMVVMLKATIFENAEENGYPFEMCLGMSGYFIVEGDEGIDKYKANAIAILFPYLRSLVTTYTSSANVSPLILPPINVNAMLRDSQNQ